jgi:Uncharacterised nucleotidyltransferase
MSHATTNALAELAEPVADLDSVMLGVATYLHSVSGDILGRVSPEMRFLLQACSAEPIAPAASANLNWGRVLELAEHHDVMPLVCRAISALADLAQNTTHSDVLHAVALTVATEYRHNLQKNIRLTQELLRVLECLDSHNIPALPYKGALLAQACYDDLALRQFSDLDLLIHPSDLARSKLALRDLGYTPNVSFSAAIERASLASGYELAFDGPLGRNLLELQWRLLPSFYSVDLPVDQLFARAPLTQLSGNHVRTLAPEDLILALCLHAAKHAWARLSWICDIDRTVRSQAIDWSVVEERARQLGIVRVLTIGLRLAEKMLGTPRVDSCAFSAHDAIAESIVEQVERLLLSSSDYDAESLAYFRLMTRSRERITDKLRFLWRLALTPATGDWSAIRLPEAMVPLYRVVRFSRLAGRAFSSLRRT